VLPHKHELEKSNEEAGRFPITSISDFYESEELVSLATHGDDQLFVDPMFVEISEISPHFPDLQIEGSCSNHEEQDFQILSYLQLEHQKDPPSPCEYVVSNYDKEEDVEICEGLLSTRILSSSTFQ